MSNWKPGHNAVSTGCLVLVVVGALCVLGGLVYAGVTLPSLFQRLG